MRVIDDEKVLAALTERHLKYDPCRASPTIATLETCFGRTAASRTTGGGNDGLHVSPDVLPAYQGNLRGRLSKAALQKLHEADRANNVVPLLRFVQVDFSAQRPDWYVEPPEAAWMLVATWKLWLVGLCGYRHPRRGRVGAQRWIRWLTSRPLGPGARSFPTSSRTSTWCARSGPGHAPSRPGTGRRGRSPAAHQPRLQDVPARPERDAARMGIS
ncbi:phage/plasmid replication protein, II/X family (plasmid) [Pseudomonas aeruginosa]